MTNLLLPFLTKIAKYSKERFVAKTIQVDAVQEKFLFNLLRAHQDTQLGRVDGLSEVRKIDQFRDRIPIRPYSSYEPYLEKITQGENHILTAQKVIYMTLTSGSTGKQKLIPTTKKSQSIVRNASLVSMGFLAEALAKRGQKFGKLLVTNSVQQWGRTPGGIDYGPSSAGVLRLDKRLFAQLFAHPYETAKLKDSLTRHYVALLFALGNWEMGGTIANFPMLILRTCNYLSQYAESLIADIAQGSIAPWLEMEPELRSQLERQWTANPVRARELQEILQSHGKLTPKLAWPNLAVVATARGGTSDFYFQRFPEYFGDTAIFGVVFSSAEGMFGIYPDVNTDGSILAIESGFFEFIPEDQWGVEHPQTLLATEVQVGQRYRILTTTYSGFYRYDIGDVIEVVGFYQQAPLIVFRHRQGGQMSSTTEKTNEHHVTRVLQALQGEFHLNLEDFCITLSERDFPARYLINIELADGDTLSDPQAFLAKCDRLLGEYNTHYVISRQSDIPPPRLRLLEKGSFDILRQRQLGRGIPDSQLKFSHISEDRNFLEGLVVEKEVRLPDDVN
ncbi:MAG: GH3 auxin-responsive promoter family protein [Hormoscilla sp. SP5CHS1]|nr:GH3 auxin-responsive promoter family protein [Hormoscilla sp. SP5CHS1]